jgi:anti-anti-sigma regulatory factor
MAEFLLTNGGAAMDEKDRNQGEPFEVRAVGNWHIVRVSQPIDGETDYEWLRGSVARLCAEGGRNLAIVLDRSSYLHSKVLSLLISWSKICVEHGVKFGLLEPRAQMISTLESMHLLNTVIRVYKSEAELD